MYFPNFFGLEIKYFILQIYLEEACEQFIGTPIVKDMLTLATKKELSGEVKQNAAIALAKLAKNNLRYVF